MIESLIKLSELGPLLDYEDMRSISNWCIKNNIPILSAGKQKYVPSNLVNLYFENSLEAFFKSTYNNSKEIMEAIKADDSVVLSELLKAPATEAVKKEYKEKRSRSKASENFLNTINAA